MNQLKEYFAKISKSPQYQKNKIFLLPIASVLVCLMVIIFVLYPQANNLWEDYSKINQSKDLNKQYTGKVDQLKKIDPTLYENNLEVAMSALPSDQAIPDAINQLLYLLGSNSLNLDNISVNNDQLTSQAEQKTTVPSLQMKIDVSGSLEGLTSFVEKAREAPRLMSINSIEVSSSISDSKVQSTISLLVYYDPQASPVVKSSDKVSTVNKAETDILNQIKSYLEKLPKLGSGTDLPKGKKDPFN